MSRCARGKALYSIYRAAAQLKVSPLQIKSTWVRYEKHRDKCEVCRAGDGGHTQPLEMAKLKKEG